MLQHWIIYDNGVEVHRLQATKEFMEGYCTHTGYTCEPYVPEEPVSQPSSEPTTEDILNVLLGVKTNEQTANG